MKDKIAKILTVVVLITSTLMFLPWTYMTAVYYIARYVLMALMLTSLTLTFSLTEVLSVRFVRLLALTILCMLVIMLFLPVSPAEVTQLITVLVTVATGVGLKWEEKEWGSVIYYYTLSMIAVTICNCLFFAGNLKVPEYYMVNEGKNQIGAMLAIGATACFFFGMKLKAQRTAFWAVCFLAIPCLILIRARSDFFAMLFCLLLIIVKDADLRVKPTAKNIISIIVVTALCIIIYTGFIGDEMHTFMFGGKNSSTINEITSRRWVRNQQGMEILKHFNEIDETKPQMKIPFIHNYPLLRLVRYGLFSFPLIFFYTYFGISYLCEIFKSRKSNVQQVGWIVCGISLIISFAEPNFPYGPGLVQLPAFLLLGYSLRQKRVTAIGGSTQEKSKVLHICNDFCNSKVHTNLYSELDNLGVEQTVYVPIRKHAAENNGFKGDHTQIVFAHILNPLHRLFFFHKIERTVRDIEKNVDLATVKMCHATTLFSDGMVAMTLNRKYGIPYVVATRNSDVNAFLRYMPHLWWVHRAVLSAAEKAIFVTESLKKRLLKHFTLSGVRETVQAKSVVIPNGITDFWHRNLSLVQSSNHNLIYAGNFSRNKNVMRLAKAVLSLRSEIPDIHLDMVGDGGAQYKSILRLSEKYPSTLAYHKRTSDPSEMKELYCKCSVFAMPSKSETFGLVYIEALTQGLKILWSNGEAVTGMFKAKVGESVNPYSTKEIAKAVKRLLNESDKYETLDERDFEQFKWGDISLKYKKLYENVCK